MNKTLLLLGGSQQQVIAIKRANDLGYRTVLCDYLPDNPGQKYADTFYQVSTTDQDGVLEIARREHADGVLAYASDPAAETAAYVAEKKGLPGNPLDAVRTLSEKHLFRSHLKSIGLPCPKSFAFSCRTSVDELRRRASDFTYPIVIKPTDASGSKGVVVLDEPAGLGEAAAEASTYSRNGLLICEEYISRTFPHIIGGDIFVVDGEIKMWGLMSCLRDARCPLVPIGKVCPSGLEPTVYSRVKDCLKKLVSSLGLHFGEFNAEVLIGPNEVPYILELGARAGGNMIPVQLSDISGIDLVRANILCAMGDSPEGMQWEADRDSVGFYFTHVVHTMESGIFKKLLLSSELENHIYRTVMYVKPGEQVNSFDGANKALGILFLRFKEETTMNKILRDLSDHISVEVESGVSE